MQFNYRCRSILPIVRLFYERPHLCGDHRRIFYRQRSLRAFLRETLKMETVVVGIITLLLFVYLLVAMLRPEKF
jgi:K+-transporting ATPase KdpF subunit